MELRDTHGYSMAYSDMVHQCKVGNIGLINLCNLCLQSLQPAIDQFLTCSTKLHAAVENTIATMSNSLEALKNIAGIAADSRGMSHTAE